ncbi:hypothetical protein VII00023_07689 [Vibrio ichthyoenteri ATCC 700023]|uniref:Uncharacterized protein n=1 Tax=Vibrio ichthyoenteri ATCC 700023 TaxID=870968 RepID=F9S4F7_9VIBR|nr:hypothetical protein VII00023_07689 [Vibrio ichthyoenteri ATCC 700023]
MGNNAAAINRQKKEKPRGARPFGVMVLLAAIRLLKVLHASNP